MSVPHPDCRRVAVDEGRWYCLCGAVADSPAPSKRAALRAWNVHRHGGTPAPKRPSNAEVLAAAREAEAEGRSARASGVAWAENPYRAETTDRLDRVRCSAWWAGWDAGRMTLTPCDNPLCACHDTGRTTLADEVARGLHDEPHP